MRASSLLVDRPGASADQHHAEFLSIGHFSSLDGLRALSVFAVIWHHAATEAFADTRWTNAGSEGVTLFFAISGFLITTLLLRERERFGAIDLRAFYVRRSLRILPLYYAVLLLYLLAVLLFERQSEAGQQFVSNLPAFLTFTSNWFVSMGDRTIFYIAWSVAAEEQFYLLWPALLVQLGSSRRALWALGFVIGVLLVLEAIVIAMKWPVTDPLPWFVYKIPVAIMLGAAGSLLLHSRRGFELLHPLISGYWTPVIYVVLLSQCFGRPVPRFIIHLLCLLIVLSTCVSQRHVLHRLLNWPALVYVGSISYGIYLLHLLAGKAAIMALGKLGVATDDWAVVFVATAVAGIVAAALSYRFFESRFLALKTRFER